MWPNDKFKLNSVLSKEAEKTLKNEQDFEWVSKITQKRIKWLFIDVTKRISDNEGKNNLKWTTERKWKRRKIFN